ncbi:MAG: ABC transporter permease [Gudongella sp.]|nr:ABC transporter permease [Gudongella sp.]
MLKSNQFNFFRTVLSILIAFALSFFIIFLISDQPVEAIMKMITGPLGSKRLFANVIELMIPLIFTGVAVSIMFSANQINLGAEGAFHLGGLVGALIGLLVPLPAGIHPIVAILLGGLAGAAFTAIPAILKIFTSASELVSSLMLNYLALFFGNYILSYYIRDTTAGALTSHLLPQSIKLQSMISGTNIHIGLIIALLVALFGYLFLYKSKMGYMLRISGENQEFAKYSGMNIVMVILISQILGGFIAGMGGTVQLLGLYRRFSWASLLGYGWDAIIVTTLAKKNPLYVPISAFFLAYIRIGADIMSRSTDVSPEIVAITQGLIIILIVADQFLAKYKHKLVAKEAKLFIDIEGGK